MTTVPESATPIAEIYWRPGCPYCSALRRDLERRVVPAVWHNIWTDEPARAFVRSANNGNETVPTVRVGATTLTNPSGAQVALLLAGDQPLHEQSSGSGPSGPATRDWVAGARRTASWLPTVGFIVAGVTVARQGQGPLGWGFIALAAAAWWLTRPMRRGQGRP